MEIVMLPISLRQVSHELRTPLTGVLGMTELLSQETLTPIQRDYLEDLRQASNQLLNVVNYLLTEAKKVSTEKAIED